MQPIDPDDVVRGQYDGYLRETVSRRTRRPRRSSRCAPKSRTRDGWACRSLRSGKCLAQSRQVITIGFEEPVMRCSRSEGSPRVAGQQTGHRLRRPWIDPRPVSRQEPGPHAPRLGRDDLPLQGFLRVGHRLEAYERLILEAMLGNHSLFTRLTASTPLGGGRAVLDSLLPSSPTTKVRGDPTRPIDSSTLLVGACPRNRGEQRQAMITMV